MGPDQLDRDRRVADYRIGEPPLGSPSGLGREGIGPEKKGPAGRTSPVERRPAVEFARPEGHDRSRGRPVALIATPDLALAACHDPDLDLGVGVERSAPAAEPAAAGIGRPGRRLGP
jgi:hypothetical protein